MTTATSWPVPRLVAVFGEDLRTDLGPGVQQVRLDGADALTREWAVLVLGPHLAAALIAPEDETTAH